jgi:cytochrome c
MLNKLLVALVAAVSLVGGSAVAQTRPAAADAVAMVEKTAEQIKKTSLAAVQAKIAAKDADVNKGELYVALRALDGTMLAHPNQKFVGGNLIDVPDPDGKLFRREIVDIAKAKGKGWVDYKFKNPVSGKVEDKTTYVLRVGDTIVEAGIYK